MITRWDQGRADIEELLVRQSLDRVSASRELADAMLVQAELHLDSAKLLSATDAPGAFQLAYDAARKSLAAILANQGLRARGAGAHATLYQAVRAQLHPPLGPAIEAFDWMRRLRNATEYPDLDKPIADVSDVEEAIPAAQEIIAAARKVLDQMPVY